MEDIPMKKKKQEGLVYSTDSDFMKKLENQHIEQKIETLIPQKQKLKVFLDTKIKPGKKITIIDNFIGKEEDLENLSKKLKSQFGVGGSVQENQIWLQGDVVNKAIEWLKKNDYGIKNK